jgi:hypothetical protein
LQGSEHLHAKPASSLLVPVSLVLFVRPHFILTCVRFPSFLPRICFRAFGTREFHISLLPFLSPALPSPRAILGVFKSQFSAPRFQPPPFRSCPLTTTAGASLFSTADCNSRYSDSDFFFHHRQLHLFTTPKYPFPDSQFAQCRLLNVRPPPRPVPSRKRPNRALLHPSLRPQSRRVAAAMGHPPLPNLQRSSLTRRNGCPRSLPSKRSCCSSSLILCMRAGWPCSRTSLSPRSSSSLSAS